MIRPPGHRLVALFAVLVLGLASVVVRLAVLQVGERAALERRGLAQRVHSISLPAGRGEILDRAGVPLAISLDARDIYADPRYVVDPETQAERIAGVLGMRPKEVRPALMADGTFAYIARHVDRYLADRLEPLALPGVGFLEVSKRYYPAGPLAAQVLGYVGVDGVGLAGLEEEYERELAGTPGERTAELSANGQPIAQGLDVVREPVDGKDLVTTLDRQIQFRAQAALADAVRANHAASGSLIVMDPRTGDVYAMAIYPWADPSRFAETNPERWRNRAVTDAFEPGSVNKVVTAAAAIDTAAVAAGTLFEVPGSMRVGDYVIHDSHPHPIELMTLGDIVAESSNIGIARVAEHVGSERLASYVARFGLGRPTGLGFPGETGGDVPRLVGWDEVRRTTISYGQGLSVTALQIACVYATIANGGEWVQPRLVRGTVDPDGTFSPVPAGPSHRVVRRSTADLVTRMLAAAVEDGTGAAAQVAGYQVAGKTGTALKPEPTGGYGQRYVASFAGFLPASEPRVLLVATIDEPTTIYGGVAAAPLFREVARYAIRRLGIEPAPPVEPPPRVSGTP